MEHSHYLKFRREEMIAFKKATKGMLCDDIYVHMWSLIRKEFEDYEKIPPNHVDEQYGEIYWQKNNSFHRLFDLPAYKHKNDYIVWGIDGKYHREWDLPAIIAMDKKGGYLTLKWYKNDELHRDGDKPADIHAELSYWYKNGKIHREGDKPAIVSIHGDMWWIQNDKLYREDGKPTIIKRDGTQIWATSDKNWSLQEIRYSPFRCGQRNFQIDPDGTMRWFVNNHPGRENDEPAVILPNGTQIWYDDNQVDDFRSVIHRDNGKPAIVCKDGSESWFERGRCVAYFKHGKASCARPTLAKKNLL